MYNNKFTFGLYIIIFITMLDYVMCNGLKVPHDVRAQQIWAGKVEVNWVAENEDELNYTVFYKPNLEQDTSWNYLIVNKNAVTLTELQSYTNYSIKVSVDSGYTKYVSPIYSVFVREGIPRTPFDLKYSFDTKFEGSLLLTWRMNDPYREILRYEMCVFQGNKTRLSTTHSTYFLLDDIYPEKGELLINVFAINKIGKSQPASLLFTESSYKLILSGASDEIKDDEFYSSISEKDPGNKPKILLYSLVAGANVVFIVTVCLLVIKMRKRSARAHQKMGDESSNSGITCYEFPPNDINRKQNGLSQSKGLLKMPNSLDSSLQIGINLSHNQHVVYDSTYSYNPKTNDYFDNKYCVYDPHSQTFDSNGVSYHYTGSSSPHNIPENIYDLPVTDYKNNLENDKMKEAACHEQYNDKGYYSPPNQIVYNTDSKSRGVPSSSNDSNQQLLNEYQNNINMCAKNTLVDVSKYQIHNDI